MVVHEGALEDVVDHHQVVVGPPALAEQVDLVEDLQLQDELDKLRRKFKQQGEERDDLETALKNEKNLT